MNESEAGKIRLVAEIRRNTPSNFKLRVWPARVFQRFVQADVDARRQVSCSLYEPVLHALLHNFSTSRAIRDACLKSKKPKLEHLKSFS